MVNRLFAWIIFPYIFTVFIACFLSREKTLEVFGSSLFEEYCIVLLFVVIFDIQRLILKK